jgi:23S rRNA (cytosine1962-C5)-methyltransferase
MKVVLLEGSPHKDGNTAALLTPFREELRAGGAESREFFLYDLRIQPCRGCRACQRDTGVFGCPEPDDVQMIFDALLECQLLVLATPIYSWYCTPPMKALLDRLVYGMNKFYGPAGKGPSLWAGRRMALLLSCGYPPEKGAEARTRAFARDVDANCAIRLAGFRSLKWPLDCCSERMCTRAKSWSAGGSILCARIPRPSGTRPGPTPAGSAPTPATAAPPPAAAAGRRGSAGSWQMRYGELTFNVKPMNFKHTGLFPEQAVNWDWAMEQDPLCRPAGERAQSFRLYRRGHGGLRQGRRVGVPCGRRQGAWWPGPRKTPPRPGLEDAPIRWIVDDCGKFVEREIRRGRRYDAIIMDPPSYGRGPGGEIWKLEDNLWPFVKPLRRGAVGRAAFRAHQFLHHGPCAVGAVLYAESIFTKRFGGCSDSQELGLPVTDSGLVLPCGATAAAGAANERDNQTSKICTTHIPGTRNRDPEGHRP